MGQKTGGSRLGGVPLSRNEPTHHDVPRAAMKWALGVWIALLGTLLAANVAASPERFAIVVGNNRAEVQSANLRYADDDAVATQRLLIEAGVRSLLLTRFDADTESMAGTLKPYGAPSSDDLERAMTLLIGEMRAAAA